MDDTQGAIESGADSFDIESLLGPGTSPAETGETPQGQEAGGAGDQLRGGSAPTAFKFGGRSFKSQAEAEKAFNKLYGQASDQKGILNRLKEKMSDESFMKAVGQDKQWREIMAKLGVEEATRQLEAAEAEGMEGEVDISQLPPAFQQAFERMNTAHAMAALDREVFSFERQLGRAISKQENDAVMDIIERAPSLSFEQAWKLAHYDKHLKEAAEKAARQSAGPAGKDKVARPKPSVPGIPGQKLDLKKPVTQMSKEEWRESIRQDPDFQRLLT